LKFGVLLEQELDRELELRHLEIARGGKRSGRRLKEP
jgi:hypothetical protein